MLSNRIDFTFQHVLRFDFNVSMTQTWVPSRLQCVHSLCLLSFDQQGPGMGFNRPRRPPDWQGENDNWHPMPQGPEHWREEGPRGPPGPFRGPRVPWPNQGPRPGGPPPRMMAPIEHDDSALIPKVPYYDLPAGLMAPLIRVGCINIFCLDRKQTLLIFKHTLLILKSCGLYFSVLLPGSKFCDLLATGICFCGESSKPFQAGLKIHAYVLQHTALTTNVWLLNDWSFLMRVIGMAGVRKLYCVPPRASSFKRTNETVGFSSKKLTTKNLTLRWSDCPLPCHLARDYSQLSKHSTVLLRTIDRETREHLLLSCDFFVSYVIRVGEV